MSGLLKNVVIEELYDGGETLLLERLRRDLTMVIVAKNCNISQQMLQKLEENEINLISVNESRKLAECFSKYLSSIPITYDAWIEIKIMRKKIEQ